MTELQGLSKEKWIRFDEVSCLSDRSITTKANDVAQGEQVNLFKWRFALMIINPDSAFNGGFFRAELTFSDDYPYQPPKFRFRLPIYHPNIYPDGQVCISILHKPGEDLMSGEDASERWSPLQGAESVLRSVLVLLDDPEINSPANVDAGVTYRDNKDLYKKRAKETVERSKADIPEGFTMPTTFDVAPPPKAENDDDFWNETDEEFDFGGSDTGEEDNEAMADFEEDGEAEPDGSDEEDE
jgi:ubiquitin-conjugating enzyme E2 R